MNPEYDVRRAARALNVSEVTMRRMLARREIGHYRKGTGRGVIVVRHSDIENYRKARTVAPLAA
jgi:excisionase family DNA binding protein